jgi:hypothetical protein
MILNPRKYKEFNKLFAEYIGCTEDEEGNFIFPDGSKMTKIMHFHDKWNWLMMVVEKIIESRAIEIGYGPRALVKIINIDGFADDDFVSNDEKTLLLNIYNACYQHIKNKKENE